MSGHCVLSKALSTALSNLQFPFGSCELISVSLTISFQSKSWKKLNFIVLLGQIPRGVTMLDLAYPDEFYNAYAEPSETMEV